MLTGPTLESLQGAGVWPGVTAAKQHLLQGDGERQTGRVIPFALFKMFSLRWRKNSLSHTEFSHSLQIAFLIVSKIIAE